MRVPPDPYIDNLNARPLQNVLDEMRNHGGEICARNNDATVTYGYAKTHDEMRALLEGQGIPDNEVVLEMIGHLD
ncbi:MAG TPA: hypothetical protein VJK52_05815 [Candidatus Nanoarchaeia archaeon]|nr:hypothetical protein [Candidatus Nanoarchaeia archaeon]